MFLKQNIYLFIYNPIYRKVTALVKSPDIKECYLLILFNLYLIDQSTKNNFQCFNLANIILFCKYKQMLILMAATHSKKVWTQACLVLCLINIPLNCNV